MRSRLVPQGLAFVLLALTAAGCGGDDDDDNNTTATPTAASESANLCGQPRRTLDLTEHTDAGGDRPCFGDTVLLRLEPDGAQRSREVAVDIPRPGRVRLCLDLLDDQPHQLGVLDAQGRLGAQLRQGDGCVDVDVKAGVHRLRLANGRPAAPDARGYMVFVHPASTPSSRAAGTSDLLGAYNISSDCPNCDLHGINFSSAFLACFELGGTSCNPTASDNACAFVSLRALPAYWMGSDFSGTRFSGAKFDGSIFDCVNFRGAVFSDSQYGPASMKVAATAGSFVSPAPTTFNECDLTGASLRNMDLTLANFSCELQSQEFPAYMAPSNLSGVDVRGANLSNANWSVSACPWGSNPSNPYCYSEGCFRLDLAHAIADSTTNLTNTNLGGADLSGWDWHKVNWATTTMQWAVLAGGDMSGTNFTSAPYAGKFFITNKSVDSLAHADLSAMNVSNTTFTNLDLSNAQLTSANLTNATLTGATLDGANFTRANLNHAILDSVTAASNTPAVFNGATFTYASLKSARLSGSLFRGAVMNPANLGNADLSGAYLEADSNGQFGRATLSGSFMLNTKLNNAHLTDAVLDGVSWYNANPSSPVATGANATLNGASFNLADLPGLDLTNAYLQGVRFTNTQLIGTNLTGAHVGRVGSVSSDLSTANLAGANLTSTDLSYANLYNAKVDTQAAAEIYIEVLADPDHYQKPPTYQYFAVDRPATLLGAGGSVSVITTSATCPSGQGGPCGAVTDPRWVAQSPPQEPTDCQPSQYDSQGNVIAVTCSSSRHPAGS